MNRYPKGYYSPTLAAVSCPRCWYPIDQAHADGPCDFDPHEWWDSETEATEDIVTVLGIGGPVTVADGFTREERRD